MKSKAASLAILAVAELAVMALWFSASAVLPTLKAEFSLSPLEQSLFTSSVQAGFVCGTLISAVLGLADRLDPRRFFMVSALCGAAANIVLLFVIPDALAVGVLRFLTGAFMAGVYPVGMKIASTWADGDLGLLIAILVGALTLGSASPHLFNAFGGLDWGFTIGLTSVFAVGGALLINFTHLGPKMGKAPPFEPRFMLKAFSQKPLRLANFGYLGHMWELYAMWAWLGVFLDASFRISGLSEAAVWARLTTFLTIGLGGVLGCLAGGALADRYGRTTVTMAAMAASGTCAVATGLLFGASPLALGAICLVWGFAVIADSAQFSASVTELSDPSHVGTMLTVQTSAGFLLTLISIHLLPVIVEAVSWRYAFMFLAVGPALGVIAMGALRRQPEAVRLAGGRR